MFYYDIEDGGVIIYYVNDNTITSIDIPESINGYPVAYISQFTFEYCFNLEYINGIKLKEGVPIINNIYICIDYRELCKYLRGEGMYLVDMVLGEIKYNINSDYSYDANGRTWYIIDGLEYKGDFSNRFKL